MIAALLLAAAAHHAASQFTTGMTKMSRRCRDRTHD